MIQRFFVSVVAITLAMGVTNGQGTTTITKSTVVQTSASDPTEMYMTYCAVCHGKEGKGDGPAAGALKKAPTDLTALSAKNGGQFPEIKVKRYIQGLDAVEAHGSRDMPIWGELFKSIGRDQAVVELRVVGLTNRLKAMQK